MTRSRVAVVLFNLGGPDSPEAVRPFLLNLFRDPAILRVPFFVRPILAQLIARGRVKVATENYALLGGKSPLLELTREQASALEAALPELDVRCFVAMRYWNPFSDAVARDVRDWTPDEIVLLPLYPHYSTTTTGSSFSAWRDAAARAGLVAPVVSICCYHSDPGFVAATAGIVRRFYDDARSKLDSAIGLRVLFSAHGLPERIVAGGDPYQFEIEMTVAGVVARMDVADLDHVVCYQSRATPQKWIDPSIEHALTQAAKDGVAVLVVPIAFVSEHSETLVELDVEYREFANKAAIPGYFRVPTQNCDPAFIAALAGLVRSARSHGPGLCNLSGGTICPRNFGKCPHIRAALPAVSA